MKSNRFWLNLLNIQRNEWPVVKQLFWLQFFQGAGISFFFTAEFARFLEKFPVHELPWVMVLSAFLLWITGFAYTILEHHIPFKKFNEGIILFMAGTMLLVRIGSTVITDNWLYYVSLAWFYVLYLLNNLEFWGIASRLFNIRQSKRLFGVISSGDIPAKFIGYTMALLFVPYTGTLNLLFLGVISMLSSIPFYKRITASEKSTFEEDQHSHGVHHTKHPVNNLYHTFITTPIIRRIAIISLLASACIILVNYGFYAKIKESYKNDVELAKFIALFMAGLRIAALITKTIFTSRLTTNLGVQKSLFITPLVLVALVSMILGLGAVNPDERFVFYIFGASSIAVDVMRTAINSPVLLTIMQPLPIHDRMRAHNIIKGIMDPFATLFCGVLLLILFTLQGEIHLRTLCYTLLLLAGGWLIGIVFVNREYLQMLVSTISSRYFSQEDFTLNDQETLHKIKEKIKTGSEQEVISILLMVASKQNPLSIELLSLFLAHPSNAVKTETIRLISTRGIRALGKDLEQLLHSGTDPEVTKEATFAVCKLAENISTVASLATSSDNTIRSAALSGMLANKHRAIRFSAEENVAALLRSENETAKIAALSVLNTVADEYDHPLLGLFLGQEKNPELLKKALAVIGRAASIETLDICIKLLPDYEKQVQKALLAAGPPSISLIEQYCKQPTISNKELTELIVIIGKIGGNQAKACLEKMMKEKNAALPATIKALYRCKYKANPDNKTYLEEIARAYIQYAIELLFMQQALTKKNQAATLLFNAIEIELLEIRELLLCLFGCIYDREKIQKSRTALLANKKETIANAMEIIEVTVKKELSKYFCLLYEESSKEERCNALRSVYRETEFREISAILQRILSEKPILFQDWTKACSLYTSRKYSIPIDRTFYNKFLHAENILLQETAQFAIA